VASDLLFELGTEEIPSRMLARALVDLPALAKARLDAARLSYGEVTALGTPRRLALVVRGLADRQPDLDERVVGPPVGAAFAADGTVTKAGLGFAAKNGVDPATLAKAEVPGKKGLYAVATRHVAGQPTTAVLPALLTELIAAIPWPKSMRWGWREVGFVRPLHWLVALYGGEVVPVRYAGVTAGRATYGHRFLAPGADRPGPRRRLRRRAAPGVRDRRPGGAAADDRGRAGPARRRDRLRGAQGRRPARRGHRPVRVPGRDRRQVRSRVPRGPGGGPGH
jgi:glycyl-tRNA synthetase beta chain